MPSAWTPADVTSFRNRLALRMALGVLALVAITGVVSVVALRTILYHQLDNTLLHLAEVEARAGAAATSSEFEFHEGVLLAREGGSGELTRYAQLWTQDSLPLVKSINLPADLELPRSALVAAASGNVARVTHRWRGRELRSVVYPLELVGMAHQVHFLQVAAPTDPVRQTLARFAALLGLLTLLGALGAYALGRRMATVALRPTGEITSQAEAISAGTLSERITAHADVEEFGRLVGVLNGMLDRLDRAFQVQRQFTADASHELRAPLTVLKGDIDVALKRERSTAEYRETLLRCREEVERLARLAGDLLILARADAALPLEHVAELDLQALVQRVVSRYETAAAARGVRLVTSGSPLHVSGDDRLLERVVGNLVGNAVRFCRPGGAVQVQLEGNGAARITVRDEGPGIPAEHVPQLFVRFFRGDPARRRDEGTGLGLAIARAGAEAHGGRLEFLGNDGGAVFRVSLPLDRGRGTPAE